MIVELLSDFVYDCVSGPLAETLELEAGRIYHDR